MDVQALFIICLPNNSHACLYKVAHIHFTKTWLCGFIRLELCSGTHFMHTRTKHRSEKLARILNVCWSDKYFYFHNKQLFNVEKQWKVSYLLIRREREQVFFSNAFDANAKRFEYKFAIVRNRNEHSQLIYQLSN